MHYNQYISGETINKGIVCASMAFHPAEVNKTQLQAHLLFLSPDHTYAD
jgi:hypothetical protein